MQRLTTAKLPVFETQWFACKHAPFCNKPIQFFGWNIPLWYVKQINVCVPFWHIFVCAWYRVIIKIETCNTQDNKHCPNTVMLDDLIDLSAVQFNSLHSDFLFGKLPPWEYHTLNQHPVTDISVTHDIPLYHTHSYSMAMHVTDMSLLPSIQSDLHLASAASPDCRDARTRVMTDKAKAFFAVTLLVAY